MRAVELHQEHIAERRAEDFIPQLDQVDGPALQLESEATATRARLTEMRLDERRHELSAEEKRNRTRILQERLNQVRNVREEAAVTAELEMVRRTLDAEEQDALARQQEALARQQEPLARHQEALARRQEAASERMQREVARLLHDAIRSGKAQRL